MNNNELVKEENVKGKYLVILKVFTCFLSSAESNNVVSESREVNKPYFVLTPNDTRDPSYSNLELP